MAKTGCPECGAKVPSTGHLVVFPCPKAAVEVIEEWTPDKYTVKVIERIPRKELETPQAVPQRSTNTPVRPTSAPESSTNIEEKRSTNDSDVALPRSTDRQERWRERNPSYQEWKRTYQREYMRRRRA